MLSSFIIINVLCFLIDRVLSHASRWQRCKAHEHIIDGVQNCQRRDGKEANQSKPGSQVHEGREAKAKGSKV